MEMTQQGLLWTVQSAASKSSKRSTTMPTLSPSRSVARAVGAEKKRAQASNCVFFKFHQFKGNTEKEGERRRLRGFWSRREQLLSQG